MSKRTERRAAERETRKLAFQESRQRKSQFADPSLPTTAAAPSISEAQLAANRANALLSSGPATSAGKSISSRNALKHGLAGKTVLLPTDDPAEYHCQLDALIERHRPATQEELNLVQAILDSRWRLDRIRSLEAGIFLKGHLEFSNQFQDQAPHHRQQLIQVETYLKYEKSLRNLHIQEARLKRSLDKDSAELSRLQAARKEEEEFAAELAQQSLPQPSAPESSPAIGFEFSTEFTNDEDDHTGLADLDDRIDRKAA